MNKKAVKQCSFNNCCFYIQATSVRYSLSHILRARNFIHGNKLPEEGFLAKCHRHFSPGPRNTGLAYASRSFTIKTRLKGCVLIVNHENCTKEGAGSGGSSPTTVIFANCHHLFFLAMLAEFQVTHQFSPLITLIRMVVDQAGITSRLLVCTGSISRPWSVMTAVPLNSR